VLWYKAWLETRWRFLVCLTGLLLPCVAFYRIVNLWQFPAAKAEYYSQLFGVHQISVGIWPYAVIFLGMGGLLRERAAGTSTLTLTLPVSRAHVIAVRVCVGFGEATVLAIVPWLVNLVVSVFLRTPYSFPLAASSILLLTSGGLVYFATAILISAIVEGEYTAIAIVFGLVILAAFLSRNVSWLSALDLQHLMSGKSWIDQDTWLFKKPLPWSAMAASLFVAVLMVLTSIGIIQRREF
jgi:ABC-type transport system involved in multi-copper enzyme maturation permease subunit